MTDVLTERRPGRPVGQDLRRRAVAAVLEKGMTGRAAALHFEVSEASVWRWIGRYRQRGHLLTDPKSGRPSRIEPERERIFRLLEERPGLSVRALQRALAAEGRVFGAASLQRFLRRHGLQRGRRHAWRPSPPRRPAAATDGGNAPNRTQRSGERAASARRGRARGGWC